MPGGPFAYGTLTNERLRIKRRSQWPTASYQGSRSPLGLKVKHPNGKPKETRSQRQKLLTQREGVP
eukprot:10324145-Heterocapsa_arctica.AAC.1